MTAPDAAPTLPGYLLTGPHGTTLVVPCHGCDRWHRRLRLDAEAGDRVYRRTNCVNYAHGYWVNVRTKPFDPRWQTPTGRISAVYTAHHTVNGEAS